MKRWARTIGVLGVLSSLAVGCGGARPRDSAQLRVIAEPDTARVYLNDHYVATARVLARRPETVRTGTHFLTITADGFFPHDVELDLAAGLTTVEISLRPVPP